jgi:hypothetical protein
VRYWRALRPAGRSCSCLPLRLAEPAVEVVARVRITAERKQAHPTSAVLTFCSYLTGVARSCAVKLGQSLMSLSRANFPTVWQEQWSSRGSLALELRNTIANPVTISCELSIAAYTGKRHRVRP